MNDTDLKQLEHDCRDAVAKRSPSVVISDRRSTRHKERTFLPAVMAELIHQTDTSGLDARERVLAAAAYCFDFMHGGPTGKGGRS